MLRRGYSLAVSVGAVAATVLLGGCSGEVKSNVPLDHREARIAERGKITGEGLFLAGGKKKRDGAESGIGVNSFLWRATLDTLNFAPLASADPFGGVIITDWYEDPNARGERFKINALIMDTELRADAVRVTLFRQTLDNKANWRDVASNPEIARKLEDAILTRARELRVKSID
jgi:hypothetical protein